MEEVRQTLAKSKDGKILNTIDNGVIILSEDPLFHGKLKDNLFRARIELQGDMNWNRNTIDMTDKDEVHIRYYLENTYQFGNTAKARDAIQIVATQNEYHPVREYLLSLTWDKIPRVKHALPHFLGVVEDDYQYECLKLIMSGAIHRVFHPGCKFEYMLCLVGGQGVGKSTFIRFLCCEDRWFTDDLLRLDDPKIYERLNGHWICELPEMVPLINTKNNESVKAFLSKQFDCYRKPYGHHPEDVPRQCVFAGSSNVIDFLPSDPSGNRRFLPIMCDASKAEIHILKNEANSRKYIEQMWAEMMYYYNQGETKLKLPEEMEKHLSEYQAPFMPDDSWKGLILDWLEKTNCQIVCVQQIYNEALKNNGKPKNSEAREIGAIMRTLTSSWIEYPNPRQIPGYGKQRGWMKLETDSGNKDQNFQTIENIQTENP